jgi:fructoselysine and glucoselysine-specific PTS system IIC component
MVGKAIVLGVIVLIANCDYFIGKLNICRPIILGVMVGLAMGDLRAGIIMGATLELAFIGAYSIGASIPPDTIVGGVLGVAFSIVGGHGPETALVLALPIASLAIFVRLLCLGVINPLLLHKADQYAEAGNVQGVETMHILGGLLIGITGGLVTAIAYVVGGPAVEAFLGVIPGFVQVGLGIATGIMPALGFALLAKLLMTKELAVFFFLGFLVAAYLNFSMTGIALLGAIIAIILVNIGRKQRISKSGTGKGGNSDDDF